MSRFLAFAFSYYDPGSPAEQYLGALATIEEARKSIEKKCAGYNGLEGEILDIQSNEWSRWSCGPGDVWMLGDDADEAWHAENRRKREAARV